MVGCLNGWMVGRLDGCILGLLGCWVVGLLDGWVSLLSGWLYSFPIFYGDTIFHRDHQSNDIRQLQK